jgi:hypothetical protein
VPTPKFARLEDIVFHLWGVLLWQKSFESPHISPSKLGSYLTEILGDGRIQTLEDWPADMQNRAAFLAEAAYDDSNPRTIRDTISALLHELESRTHKQTLAHVRNELTDAEKAGDRSRVDELLHTAHEHQKRIAVAGSSERTFVLID